MTKRSVRWGLDLALLCLICLALVGPTGAEDNAWTSLGPYTAYVVDAVVADPSNPQTVYISSLSGGLWKSVDGGTTLTYAGNGMPLGGYVRDVVIDPTDPRTMYVGLFGGVGKTVDGGASWQQANQGMPADTYVFFLVMAPSNPRTIFAHSSKGLFKSTDAGTSWTMIHPGQANPISKALAIDPENPRTLYFTTTKTDQSEQGVFKSADGGTSWTGVSAGTLTRVSVNALAIDPSRTQTVYAGTSDGVYRTTVASPGPASAPGCRRSLFSPSISTPPPRNSMRAQTPAGFW
ncbi:MAG: hypothetical protein EXS64_02325 [Candidatus Latescibacteria bacterium]|nr:hypothetical protein [Candidatus Latescibacterota bacterium]